MRFPLEDAWDRIRELQDDNERLRVGLWKYGDHRSGCSERAVPAPGQEDVKVKTRCTCGFEAFLRANRDLLGRQPSSNEILPSGE